MFFRTIASLSLLAAFTWSSPGRAAESYDSCTGFITTLPTAITTPGTWCLIADLATGINSGAAITVNTNNVTINCNEFKVGGASAGLATMAVGINADGRSNVTVRNCSIRGFWYGMSLEGDGALAENNRMDGNTWVSLGIGGNGSVARNNRILNTGGTTAVFGNTVKAVGLYSNGNVEIYNNLVSGVRATVGSNGLAFGINPINNSNGAVYGNNIKEVKADGTGAANGISFFNTTGRVTVQGNNVIGLGAGVNGNIVGIWCPVTNKVAVLDNLVSGFTMVTENCAFEGENTFPPS